jgi:2-polyprenyl-6-methoxyphenol hydroxylase-like FAD-dependent oxidoreductase
MRVLITGGGPTGLALGIDLARRGVEVRVVDKQSVYFHGSRGDTIQPRTLEVFNDLGVLDPVLQAGSLPLAFRVYLDGRFAETRRMAELQEPRPDRPYPNAWMLGQTQIEGILRARLREWGVQVELATELIALEQDQNEVTATLSTGEIARFDYLVGADGGASFVRKAIGVAFPGTTDETFRMVIGDVVAPGLDPASSYWFATATNPMAGVAMTPLPGTEMFQLNTVLGESDDASLPTMQAALDRFSAEVHLSDCHWSTVWRPNVRLAERYRVGRVFLAGDAAHVHPPTGGQGMNTGVQDAYNLGWKLAAQTALDSYQAERRTVAAKALGMSTDLLTRYIEGRGDAHLRGEEHFGLVISYRAADATGALTTGDRAPDAPVLDANGNKISLFDLFRGPHFTRLTFGTPASPAEHAYVVLRPTEERRGDTRYVIDSEGHAFTAYAASTGDSFLIRPDGYLG